MDINIDRTGTGTGKSTGEIEQEVEKREEKKLKEGTNKKRGRKKKENDEVLDNICDQNKFFIDVSKDNEQRLLLQGFLQQANDKTYGRDIILKDLVLIALPKLTTKDIEKIQESSLSEMERVERALDEHNRKAEIKLTLGEFLVKKLSLQ
jgi:hypothetical protein